MEGLRGRRVEGGGMEKERGRRPTTCSASSLSKYPHYCFPPSASHISPPQLAGENSAAPLEATPLHGLPKPPKTEEDGRGRSRSPFRVSPYSESPRTRRQSQRSARAWHLADGIFYYIDKLFGNRIGEC